LVVTDTNVAPHYLQRVLTALTAFDTQHIELPAGEAHKNLDTVSLIYDNLMQNRFDRNSTLIALGGGVVGDITGFAAASYQRGVTFLQVPTTLLAQVDSSVGGKTGVNHPMGKNMIGAFHQPACVIADMNALDSLPERELKAGLAEVIKYGLIDDAEFFNWLDEQLPTLLQRDKTALSHAVARCCANKAPDALEKTIHVIDKAGLPTTPPDDMNAATCLELMSRDKKVRDKQLTLVLMKDIGQSFLSNDFDQHKLASTLNSVFN